VYSLSTTLILKTYVINKIQNLFKLKKLKMKQKVKNTVPKVYPDVPKEYV